MDATDLRVEKIRNTIALAESTSHLHARLYVALVAVAVTAAASVAGALLTGQVGWLGSSALMMPLALVIAVLLLRILGLKHHLANAYKMANQRIDRLIQEETQHDDDGPTPHEAGA